MNRSAEHQLGSMNLAAGEPSGCSALQWRFMVSKCIRIWRSRLSMNRRWGRGIHAASTCYGTGTYHAEAA